jgi:two-component system, NarL family, invasion response regulator UvrY
MIKILVADDHAVVRRGLNQIVAERPDMRVCGEARDAREVLALLRKGEWDVLVLDINMPDQSGLEVLGEVKRQRPELPVLILSMHPEEQFAVRALKSGASGYLTKESAPEELVAAIHKVHGGGKYVSPSLAEKLAFALERGADAPHEALSDREYQVLCLIASGKTVGEIAEGLYLSVKTVSTYRARVLEKMGMKTNAELTRYAICNRLVG